MAEAIAAGKRPDSMKDDEAALYDLATALYRDRKVTDPVYKAALEKFGERGIMDIIGIIGYYDLVSMTLITMQAGAAERQREAAAGAGEVAFPLLRRVGKANGSANARP